MIVRPDGIPPFKVDDPWSADRTYFWDYISRFQTRFRLQLEKQGLDGYRSQMLQYLAAETARWSQPSPATSRAEPGLSHGTGLLPAPASGSGSQGAEPSAAPASVPFAAPASEPWHRHSPMGAQRFAALASGSGSQGAEPLAAPAVAPKDAAGTAVVAAAAAFGFTRGRVDSLSDQTPPLPSPGPPPSYPPPGCSATWYAHQQKTSSYKRQIWVPDAQLQGAEPVAAPAAGSSGSGSREMPESQQPEAIRVARKRRQCGVGLIGTDKWNFWSESYSGSPSPDTQPGLEMTPAERKEGLDYLKLEWCRKNCRAALGVHVGGGDTGGDLNCPHCQRYNPYHDHGSSDSSGSCESPQSQQQPRAPAADADGSAGSSFLVSLLAQDDSEDDGALLQACRQAEAESPQSRPSMVPPTPSPPAFVQPPILPPPSLPAVQVSPLNAPAMDPPSAQR